MGGTHGAETHRARETHTHRETDTERKMRFVPLETEGKPARRADQGSREAPGPASGWPPQLGRREGTPGKPKESRTGHPRAT